MQTTKYIRLNAFFVIFYLFLSGFSPGQTAAAAASDGTSSPDWLDGVWAGIGYQLDNDNTWTITFTCDSETGRYQIEYPSIPCGGRWLLTYSDDFRAVFTEDITQNRFRCVQGSEMVITRVDANHVSFTCFSPYDGTLNAHSTLQKMPNP